MCKLCVGLASAINNVPTCLALGRIGSHSRECLFGTARSFLRGGTRSPRSLSPKVDAILKDLRVETYIRRFRSLAGHTLLRDVPYPVDIEFVLHFGFGDLVAFLLLARLPANSPKTDMLTQFHGQVHFQEMNCCT
jgi:hypothetical protein